MRPLLIALALAPAIAWATPAKYAVECTAPCAAFDGTTQPSGTILNIIVADSGFVPSDAVGKTSDVKLAPYTGQTIYAPAAPAQTLAQQAAAALAHGLKITSTSTPALDGTYSVDLTAQQNVKSIELYALSNGTFPGGASSYPWLDASGQPHIIPSVTEFKAFASAIADYVATLTMIEDTGSGTLPPATATIP